MSGHKSTRLLEAISVALALVSVGGSGIQRQNASIAIQSPLPDERFLAQEPVKFKASFRGVEQADQARAIWSSSVTGELGRGAEIDVRNLAAGTHDVTVSLDGASQSIRIREFNNLLELSEATPADAELQRIRAAFSFTWTDGSQPDERWRTYDPPVFDQQSLGPSKLVLLSRLDVLRHQAFAEPLPFGDGMTIYEYLRRHVKTFVVRLDCGIASGGGGTISLSRHASIWHASTAGNCKEIRPGQQPLPYAGQLALIIHEGRHNDPGDPRHTPCRGHPGLDASLDKGSGFAWSVLYSMWVYKYGLFDPAPVKASARQVARSMLQSAFCSAPSSSNPKVQAIIEEILAPPSKGELGAFERPASEE
jgi:hypothetical protein